MLTPLIIPLFLAAVLAGRAAETPAARWEGKVQIPGLELTLVVDLAQDSGGAWIGSIIVPGMNVKGAPLSEITLKGSDVSFASKEALGGPSVGPATFKARLTPQGTLAGNLQPAGNSAPFMLEKTGPPQVELPKRCTPLGPELAGEWKGQYELGGYPRDVTLKLAGEPGGAAKVEFIIVGKKVNNIPVDLVRLEGDFLTIVSNAFGMTLEGQLRREAGEIKGSITQGPFEVPLILRRTP